MLHTNENDPRDWRPPEPRPSSWSWSAWSSDVAGFLLILAATIAATVGFLYMVGYAIGLGLKAAGL